MNTSSSSIKDKNSDKANESILTSSRLSSRSTSTISLTESIYPSTNTIQLLIHNLSGKVTKLDIDKKNTIESLKNKLLENGQFAGCSLKWKNTVFYDENKTIESYGLNSKDHIYMLARLGGGRFFYYN